MGVSSIYPDAAVENMKQALISAVVRTTGCSKEDAAKVIETVYMQIWRAATEEC